MRMQLTLLAAVLSCASSFAWAQLTGSPKQEHVRVLLNDSKLVYAQEISSYTNQLSESPPAPWPKALPKNIDAVAAGKGTVFGFYLPDCNAQRGGYLPSDCGDEEIIAIALKGIPTKGDIVSLNSENLVAAAMFLGSRHGPGRSGCLGFPSSLAIQLLDHSEGHVSLSVDITFELVSHFRYPRTCGKRSISGTFDFLVESTEDVADGGLRLLFP
jgi:hypothetical protein